MCIHSLFIVTVLNIFFNVYNTIFITRKCQNIIDKYIF